MSFLQMKHFVVFLIISVINNQNILINCEGNDSLSLDFHQNQAANTEPAARVEDESVTQSGLVEIEKPNIAEISSCPSLENSDTLSYTQFFKRLVHECRFDPIQRPEKFDDEGKLQPVDVHVRTYIYFLQNLGAHDLQFRMQALLQVRFVDPRLAFRKYAPNRTAIIGEENIRRAIWMPHIFMTNEMDSGVLGMQEKDVLTSISPDGTVIVSTRMKATLFCTMDLRKFPFDSQMCETVIENWKFNVSDVQLKWETEQPVTLGPNQHFKEYYLLNLATHQTIIDAGLNDLQRGAFTGNYSTLSFTVTLRRESGYYLLEYFFPSMMIVGISWASFCLQADQTAPRVMLGTATMLTFITLASAQGKNLPKVSYVKASEIWSMGCTGFIFATMLEFTITNMIWRRKRNVALKKVKATHILKETIQNKKGETIKKSNSNSSLRDLGKENGLNNQKFTFTNNLNASTLNPLPTIITEAPETGIQLNKISPRNGNDSFIEVYNDSPPGEQEDSDDFTEMTPHQISRWLDRQALIIFPSSFLMFNMFYWIFVNL